jgi:hypothetical protein
MLAVWAAGTIRKFCPLTSRRTGHAIRQPCGAATKAAMKRELVWIEQKRFRGFGCSECGWRFKSSNRPAGTTFDEMMRLFELQRDKEFTSHVCADHSKSQLHDEQES